MQPIGERAGGPGSWYRERRRRLERWLRAGGLSLTLGMVGLSGVGCASTETARGWAVSGDALADGQAAVEGGPVRDRVLWQYRTALVAMRRGDYAEARRLLDDALLTVGAVLGKSGSGRKARSVFREESAKTFLGEPYERVMAYYYRGILYWMDGEPDNARACFRSGQIQDADGENREYASDWLLLDYLDGLASMKLGGDGSDAIRRAEGSARWHRPIPPDAKANVMVFAEFGRGPTKYATGEFREQLRIRPGESAVARVRVRVGETRMELGPLDDLSFQATTRGGRVMDHVLANKAVFKSTSDAVGDAALISGAILAGTQSGRNSKADEVGFGLMAFGLIGKIVAASTKPAADTRSWDNLPNALTFGCAQLPPGRHRAEVEFLDGAGNAVAGKSRTVEFEVAGDGRDTVLFLSDSSS